LFLICLASACWALSFGLGSQVISHWLRANGHSDGSIGLNHATYYLGLALASVLVPALMRRWGAACAAVGLIVTGVSLGLFPWAGSLAGLFGLRLVNGAAAGLSLIPLETLISRASAPEQRTRNFGFYAVALTLTGAVGIWAGLHLYRPGGTLAFYLGSAFPLAAGLMLLAWLPRSIPEAAAAAPVAVDLERHFLSFGTGWSQGFLEGGMLAFLSFFLISLGMSADAAGALMGVVMAGVILFQIPVSWLADRLGKVPVLLGCYAVVIFGLVAVPMCGTMPALALCLFAFGACSGALYPLGLSLLGEGVPESGLARLYAWYMAVECIGSQMGAAAMGKARDWWGEKAMFAAGLAAVVLVLLAWLALRALTRQGAGNDLASSPATSSREAA
jgi:MFS family permease